MNAASWLALTIQLVQRDGQPVTLRRMTGTQQIPMNVDVMAVIRGADAQQLAGGMTQQDRTVVISNQEIAARNWPGPPQKNDRIVMGDDYLTVQSVETVQMGDTVIRHNLMVRG